MIPSGYFPFHEPRYELKIGASPIPSSQTILEEDSLRAEELALKQACLAWNQHYYVQALPDSGTAQEELCRYLAMPRDCATILAAGNQVQEDLLLLDAKQPGLPLIAGHLCFANAWCLDDKLGLPFMAIHGPVPDFDKTIGPPSERLLERLKPDRPVWRINWAVKAAGQLDLTSRWDAQVAIWNSEVTPENAGARCWMRIERQTLSLLPQTQTILFTLHTYTQPVETLPEEQRQILKGVLETCPEPMLRYKGISPFLKPLLEYLDA
jgi:dimethylamine monooxygenase subunit A